MPSHTNAKVFAWLANISGLYFDGFGCLAAQWKHYLQGSLPWGLMKCSCSHGCLFPRQTGIKFLLPQKLCNPKCSFTPVLGLCMGLSCEDRIGMGRAHFRHHFYKQNYVCLYIFFSDIFITERETRSWIG